MDQDRIDWRDEETNGAILRDAIRTALPFATIRDAKRDPLPGVLTDGYVDPVMLVAAWTRAGRKFGLWLIRPVRPASFWSYDDNYAWEVTEIRSLRADLNPPAFALEKTLGYFNPREPELIAQLLRVRSAGEPSPPAEPAQPSPFFLPTAGLPVSGPVCLADLAGLADRADRAGRLGDPEQTGLGRLLRVLIGWNSHERFANIAENLAAAAAARGELGFPPARGRARAAGPEPEQGHGG